VYNGDFEAMGQFAGENEPLGYGWATSGGGGSNSNSDSNSKSISFIDVPAAGPHGGHGGHGGGGRTGRAGLFNASAAGDVGWLSQALTLCPGATYRTSALARAPGRAAFRCRAVFSIGGQQVGVLAPPGGDDEWDGELLGAADYTVGPDDADASVELKVDLACPGAPDMRGDRILEIDDISVEMVG
jgi:hypothetical protein